MIKARLDYPPWGHLMAHTLEEHPGGLLKGSSRPTWGTQGWPTLRAQLGLLVSHSQGTALVSPWWALEGSLLALRSSHNGPSRRPCQALNE